MAKQLIIGIDVRDLKVAKTGTRTYLLELCREFENLNSNTLKFEFIDTSASVYTGNNKILKWLEHLRYQTWKQIILPIKASLKRCDIVFCTDNFVPLIHLGYKTIPVFHDAFFFETPQNYGKLWLWLYKKTALPAAKQSAIIITPTAYSKKQLIHYTAFQPEKFEVVFEGATNKKNNNNADDLSVLKLPISNKEYILHAGAFFKRKNIPTLIKAFAQLKTDRYNNLKLVLAGPIPTNQIENDYFEITKTIDLLGLTDDVVITGYLPDDHLSLVYQHALLYAFPSINEGFGLPVLEAFSYNIPVVVANNSCLPEVGGDAVLSFDPFKVDDIAQTLKKVLDNETLRMEMISKGKERLSQFSWAKSAQQLVDIFKRVANN